MHYPVEDFTEETACVIMYCQFSLFSIEVGGLIHGGEAHLVTREDVGLFIVGSDGWYNKMEHHNRGSSSGEIF